MKTYVQAGNTLPYTNASGGTLPSGQGVLLGTAGLFGVLNGTLLDTEIGEATTQGVFKIAKTEADVAAQWANAYWDDTAKEVTVVASTNKLIGAFTNAYGAVVVDAEILLIPAIA
tara:strand:+ start:7725 stop:8069 length:345 start_codon:yes stop_codon:yes gene_type:complete